MLGRGDTRGGALRRVLVAVALCLCAPFVLGAPPGVFNVRFRSFSTAEGLSQATAYTIVQDQNGFLWIGTQDGLDRFDGYGFRVYRHARGDAHSLADNNVPAL